MILASSKIDFFELATPFSVFMLANFQYCKITKRNYHALTFSPLQLGSLIDR